jgi:hypothetical protein
MPSRPTHWHVPPPTWEGVPLDELLGHLQQPAYLAHLVLEQLPEWLHQLELQVLGQAAHVVVGLDGVAVLLAAAGGRARLDDVRVQRALQAAGDERLCTWSW